MSISPTNSCHNLISFYQLHSEEKKVEKETYAFFLNRKYNLPLPPSLFEKKRHIEEIKSSYIKKTFTNLIDVKSLVFNFALSYFFLPGGFLIKTLIFLGLSPINSYYLSSFLIFNSLERLANRLTLYQVEKKISVLTENARMQVATKSLSVHLFACMFLVSFSTTVCFNLCHKNFIYFLTSINSFKKSIRIFKKPSFNQEIKLILHIIKSKYLFTFSLLKASFSPFFTKHNPLNTPFPLQNCLYHLGKAHLYELSLLSPTLTDLLYKKNESLHFK